MKSTNTHADKLSVTPSLSYEILSQNEVTEFQPSLFYKHDSTESEGRAMANWTYGFGIRVTRDGETRDFRIDYQMTSNVGQMGGVSDGDEVELGDGQADQSDFEKFCEYEELNEENYERVDKIYDDLQRIAQEAATSTFEQLCNESDATEVEDDGADMS